MIHALNMDSDTFNAIISGHQTFVIMTNHRPIEVGDLLALNEYDGQAYSGNSCLVYVDFLEDNPEYLQKNMIIAAIKPCTVYRHTEPFNPNKLSKDYSVPLATKEE